MKTIELLLLENVDNLGIVGDVVKVRPGYARNYLLPHGLATVPTPGAVKALEARRAQVEAEMKKLAAAQEELIKQIDGYELTIQRAANEQGVLFAGVSQHDIAQAMQEAGFDIEDRFVRVGEQIKRLDSYQIPIVIHKDLKAEIKLWVVSDKPAEELESEGEASEDTSETEVTSEMNAVPKNTADSD